MSTTSAKQRKHYRATTPHRYPCSPLPGGQAVCSDQSAVYTEPAEMYGVAQGQEDVAVNFGLLESLPSLVISQDAS